jgi:hypothetical protein
VKGATVTCEIGEAESRGTVRGEARGHVLEVWVEAEQMLGGLRVL